MKITIAVDAPPIFSALLGGAARRLFFDDRFRFITTDFTLGEVEKYIPFIARKSGRSEERIRRGLGLLPLRSYGKMDYQRMRAKAEALIGERDPKDVDILALALIKHAILWTEDKHFEGISEVSLVHTRDML
ncbi:MAG: hypothetical protein J7M27_13730 [Candidatus Latescibacteria bacterium]|nr:hypothetical protein [Candidatus Latescibacterota bacterium]